MSNIIPESEVVVTGMGAISPNGTDLDSFWENTLKGKSGITFIDSKHKLFPEMSIGGKCKDFKPEDYLPSRTINETDRYSHLGLAATKMALEDSALENKVSANIKIGVIIGSGLGGQLYHEENIAAAYENGLNHIHPFCIPKISPNSVPARIAIDHGITGPNLCISTACSSGVNAIGEAYLKIKTGQLDMVICGGVENPLTPFTFVAYQKLKVLSKNVTDPEQASRPFDQDRDGFILSEGAGILILENRQLAEKRSAKIYGKIKGFSTLCGAYHMAVPRPDASDIIEAMDLVLKQSNLNPVQISCINAHGTATLKNDEMELLGIEKVFGDYSTNVPITASKSMIGHSISAAGALETIICLLSIKNQMITPSINLEKPEKAFNFIKKAKPQDLHYILKNSFGFGSNNSCLVLEKY